MNSKLLLLFFTITTLASCSTAYKTGQTPDDVYYSPVRFYGENSEEKKETAQNREDYSEERQIRMRIYDRRWRSFDNDIYYNPYQFGYNYGYYYNPFYYTFPVYNTCACACVPSNPKTSTPRMTNLGGYGTGYNYVNTTNSNPKYNIQSRKSPRGYNNSNNTSSLGNTLNKVFNNGNSSNNNNSSSSNTRSYSPSSSSSSSSSGSSSSGGSTSRPARSGRN